MKKMLPWLITILLSITLIVVAIVLLSDKFLGDNSKNQATANAAAVAAKLSANEIVSMSSEITGIKTNLADPYHIASMAFAFQLNDKKAKEEFDKIKEIKIRPIIIKTLADTKPELLNDSKGREQFIAKLQNLINKSLTSGQLIQIDITDILIAEI